MQYLSQKCGIPAIVHIVFLLRVGYRLSFNRSALRVAKPDIRRIITQYQFPGRYTVLLETDSPPRHHPLWIPPHAAERGGSRHCRDSD